MHKMRPFHLFPNSILVRYPRAHNFVLNPNTILQEIHNKKCHRLDLNQNSLASTQLRLHFYGYNLPSKMSLFLTGWSHHNFRFCGWILTSGLYLTRYLPILRPRKRPKILWKITFETFFPSDLHFTIPWQVMVPFLFKSNSFIAFSHSSSPFAYSQNSSWSQTPLPL